MKLISSLLLIAALCKLEVKAASDIIGNLAFYGRGQRHLPMYWNEIDKIKGSKDAKIYFPYNESDESANAELDANNEDGDVEDDIEEATESIGIFDKPSEEIIDKAKNNPFVMYLPGKKDRKYSEIDFYITSDDKNINLCDFHRVKSEMKIVPPPVEDLIAEGYTCESIGLSCTDLRDYDFEKNKSEWQGLVNIVLSLESEVANSDQYLSDEEKESLIYDIENIVQPTTEWSEVVGDIIIIHFVDFSSYAYTDFVFKNKGTMPVYIYVGNTIFLKKEPTDMVKDGIIQNNFSNWSWHQSTTNKTATYYDKQVYEGDPEQKNCVKFMANEDGDFAYYVHIENGISAPPEGVSFIVRPMNDNQFKFKIDNKKEYNLTHDYLIDRNCQVPIGEETEFIIDVRSLVYADSKYMLMNDISGFWLQTISEISNIKQRLNETIGEEAAEEYKDVLYFYTFTLHHTFPEDTTKYVKVKLDPNGKECEIGMQTHADWAGREDQWPDDIDFESIFSSKNSVSTIEDSTLNNEDETTNNETSTTTAAATTTTTSSSATSTNTNDDSDSAFAVKPVLALCLLSSLIALLI